MDAPTWAADAMAGEVHLLDQMAADALSTGQGDLAHALVCVGDRLIDAMPRTK